MMQLEPFDKENRLEKLDKFGESLVRLNLDIDWGSFAPS